jgi:hypothetical protein
MATLNASNGLSASAAVIDLSRGGISVVSEWQLVAGAEVTVELPGMDGAVGARVVRADTSGLGLVFRQDTESLARIDRVLLRFGQMRQAA